MRVHIDGLDAPAGDHDLPAPDIVRVGMPPRGAAGARAGSGADRRGELAVGEHDPAVAVAGAHLAPSPSPFCTRPARPGAAEPTPGNGRMPTPAAARQP